jgi:YD repeat-containing protein
LYNGNITSMAVNIRQFVQPQLYNYQYDQLNRIVGMDVYRGLNETTNSWAALVATNLYKERVAYDPNGNILKYLRHGDNAANVVMDSLTYKYNVDASGDLVNNRLRQVRDAIADATYANVDLDNQTNLDNYGYDAIGNLTSDVKEGITSVLWTVYGKIKEINKTTSAVTGTVQKISYTYDASGNRLSKTVTKVGTANDVTTWYVRDASGNIMGIYEAVSETPNAATGVLVNLVEHDLYGSSRLGVVNKNVNIDVALPSAGVSVAGQVTSSSLSVLVRGLKNYELSNHLGNVLVTISDKKLGVSANGTTIDYYTADVVTANDYYPFGMLQPGRKFEQTSGKNYRFSINGQEKEKDLNENITSAMYWEYDSRIGRRWNVDPVVKTYESPYAAFANNPIWFVDFNGSDTSLNLVGGGNVNATDDLKFTTFEDKSYTVEGSNNVKAVGIKKGMLATATVDGVDYKARFNRENGEFDGYKDDNGNILPIYEISVNSGNGSGALPWSGVYGGIAREYYITNVSNLKSIFTSTEGVIDFAGGSAARTSIKEFVRRSLMNPVGSGILDIAYPNTNPYPGKLTPSFWKTSKFFNGLTRATAVVSVAMILWDAKGVYNYYNNPSSDHVVHPLKFVANATAAGLMTYGGIPGAVLGGVYFGGNAMPGGWPALLQSGYENTQANRKLLNEPGWSPRGTGGLD